VIAKITRGGNFRGATRYALDERHGLDREHQPEIIGGNMAGRSSTELTREFEAVRQQRPDIRKPVEHVSLSFARDERPLSNDDMARLADEYLKRTASNTWSFGTTTRTTSTATSCSTGSGRIGLWSLSSIGSTSVTRRPVEPSSGTSAFGLYGTSASASASGRLRERKTGWQEIEAWPRRRSSSKP
jgi:hypothetical protein